MWGIDRRLVAQRSEGETALSMAVAAGRSALHAAGESVENVDLVLANSSAVYGQCADYNRFFPHWCCEVREALGARRALAWNVEMECISFLTALQIAIGFVRQKRFRRVLVCSAEHTTQHLDYTDRSSTIFADGGAAALVTDDPDGSTLLSSAFHTQSEMYSVATVRWVYPQRLRADRRQPSDFKLYFNFQDADAMQAFVPTTVPSVVKKALGSAGLTPRQIDYFVFHQPAERLIKAWAEGSGDSDGRYDMIVRNNGSQGSVALPTALMKALEDGKIRRGHHVVLAGAATGWSYGAQVWRWGNTAFAAAASNGRA
jgi:putative alkyl quinolone biosynthesis protein PqsC